MNRLTVPIIIASVVLAGSVLLLQGASIETHVLITDFYGHRVMDVDRTDTTDSPQGTVVWQYGNVNNLYATPPGAGHGIGPNQLFKVHNAKPLPNGNVLIADWGNHRVIEVDRNKNTVWQYGNASNLSDYTTDPNQNSVGMGSGFNQLYKPWDADRLSDGTTLITDSFNHRVIIVDVNKNILWQYGNLTAGSGYNQLNDPTHAEVLPNGHVLIADMYNHRVVEIDRTNLTAGPNGTIVWQYGTTGVIGSGFNQLYNPINVNLIAGSTNILISDWYNHRVIEVDRSKTIVWQYGTNGVYGTGPNYMRYPEAAYVISNGNTLISDVYNKRVIEIDRANHTAHPNGTIVYQYGTTNVPGTGPNQLNYPPDAEEILAEAPPPVVGRYVFYNDSAFDGYAVIANTADDGAIAPDKTALLPGQSAGFANYTSYSLGINGIMVDIRDLPPGTPTAADFEFKVGNDGNPAAWATAPAPLAVVVREGAGADGSDRVSIVWVGGSIQKQWLRVTVKATAATGLTEPDVFYFGNAIGETGNSATEAKVTPTDQVGVRNNPHTLLHNPADIDDAYDFNRDQKVGPTDELAARNNGTNASTALQLITVP